MDDRQAVGINRAAGLLGYEVVHHAEEGGGEEEAHSVMAVPPLHHCILHAGIGGIGLVPGAGAAAENPGQLRAVDDMQQRDHQDIGAKEPVGHVDVLGLALDDGAEKHQRIGHPHHRDQQVDRPFQFGVFLGSADAERQRHRRQHDHERPAPEGEGGQFLGPQSHLAGTLHDVVRHCEHRRAAKSEDHRIGMQRSKTSVGKPFDAKGQFRPDQLRSQDDPDQHPDDPPHHRHDGELADDLIVVGCRFHTRLP